MPVETLLFITVTLATIAVVVAVVLYTLIMHHIRTPAIQVHSARQSWLSDVIWACIPWLIVLALMYPTLTKIFALR
jgi:heme/copper-type cytochrome/quinol oxidase subunit 2